MKKRYLVLGVAALLLVAAACLAYWQRNNLTALYYLKTMQTENLQEQISRNDDKLKQTLEENALGDIQISDEELEKVVKGELSAQDMAQQIVEAQPTPTPAAPGEPVQTAPPKKDNTQAIQTQVAAMYVLKATFVSRLEGIVQSAKNEYLALSVEQRTTQAKTDIVYGKASALSALEKECDGEVAKVIAEVKRLLKESGRDMSLADKLAATYDQEKSLKKAYYIKELEG